MEQGNHGFLGRIWLLVCALATLGLAGCGDEQPATADAAVSVDAMPVDAMPTRYRVRGEAAGVIEPVRVRLVATGVDELLSVTGDGPFAFAAEMRDGESYVVQFVDAPEKCAMDYDVGTVVGEDAAFSLWCGMLDALELAGSGVPALEFSTVQLAYRADVPLMRETVAVIATASRPDIELTVVDQPANSGQPSEPVVLGLGESAIPVIARHPASGAEIHYEITLDRAGAIIQEAYGKASNTEGFDQFGYSVAMSGSGDTVAVGAYQENSGAVGVDGDQTDGSAPHSGAVYVFVRQGTVWAQQAYIKASNTETGDSFGYSVALNGSGDTLAVGAYQENSGAVGVNGDQTDNSVLNSGAAYVFVRQGTVWSQQAYLKASNTDPSDWFGYSVSMGESGDTLAVGAQREQSIAVGVNGDQTDNSGANGAVYVFVRAGATWTQQAYLKPSNSIEKSRNVTGPGFGHSVAMSGSGETVAVGAPWEYGGSTGVNGNQTDYSSPWSGAVYVFTWTGTVWAQQAYIKASNTDDYDGFGESVAVSGSGDTLAVSARREASGAVGVDGDQADNSVVLSGAVYVFVREGQLWAQQAYIKASNTGESDEFGHSVAVSGSGDTLAVSAAHEASGAVGVDGDQADSSAPFSGAVYIFGREGQMWAQKAYIKASNTGASDLFGDGVALNGSGETLAIGARGEDSGAVGVGGDQSDNSAMDSGAVYIFH